MSTDENLYMSLDKTTHIYSLIEADILEFAQGATDFQIEVFIANGEGPIDKFPVHAYRHLLAQVRPLISEMRRVLIEKERINRKITKLEKEKPEDWDLDVLEMRYRIADFEVDLKGKWSTYGTYEKLLGYIRSKYGPFKNEDLQKQEAEYWKHRLSKQMFDSKQGALSGYGSGNINSLRMAQLGSILPGSPHHIEPFTLADKNLLDNIQNKDSLSCAPNPSKSPLITSE